MLDLRRAWSVYAQHDYLLQHSTHSLQLDRHRIRHVPLQHHSSHPQQSSHHYGHCRPASLCQQFPTSACCLPCYANAGCLRSYDSDNYSQLHIDEKTGDDWRKVYSTPEKHPCYDPAKVNTSYLRDAWLTEGQALSCDLWTQQAGLTFCPRTKATGLLR
jgi:hypothetical protein